MAFVRISESRPIRVRTEITEPDVVVVLDPGLVKIVNVVSGLKSGGFLVLNTKKPPESVQSEVGKGFKVATVDATRIAREILGVPITNTTMIGSLLKASGILKLESLFEPVKERFGRLAERNIEAMKKSYEETKIKE